LNQIFKKTLISQSSKIIIFSEDEEVGIHQAKVDLLLAIHVIANHISVKQASLDSF